MRNLIKQYGTSIVAGAFGAGVILLSLNFGEALGKADGKKKNKKQRSIIEEVVNEVNRPNLPQADGIGNAHVPPAGNMIPNEPILEPADAQRCAQNYREMPDEAVRYSIVRGEVREYRGFTGAPGELCVIKIYAQGCEGLKQYYIAQERPVGKVTPNEANLMCRFLENAAFSTKKVTVSGYMIPSNENRPYFNTNYATDVALSIQSIDGYLQEQEEAKRRASEALLSNISVPSIFNSGK